MQVSVKNTGTSGIEYELTVSVPVAQVNRVVAERMREFSEKARVPGFRPGKIPKNVLEQRFGTQVRQEALGKVIETSLPIALEQEGLRPAGQPVVEQITHEIDQDLQYVVTFQTMPVVELSDFTQIVASRYQVTASEADVDQAIVRLQNQFAEWVVVDREACQTDRLIIDYTSTIHGKPYEHNSAQDIHVELGSQVFIEGFEQGLIGSRAGDKRVLDLTFPSEWRLEKLAGKAVQFTVTVKAVTEKRLAELDAEFARKIGAASPEPSVLRAKIEESLEKQIAERVEAKLKEEVISALLNRHPIPIPRALVDREVAILHEEMHRRMGEATQIGCHHPGLLEQAQKRVALGLILNKVIQSERIIADEDRVKARISTLSKMFGNTEFIENMYYESEELLSGVRHTVLLDAALDFVISQITITEKPLSVDELFYHQS